MTKKTPAPTCAACCPKCGLHFKGAVAFDLHLGGESNDWAHHHPLDVTKKDGRPAFEFVRGECRLGPDRLEGVQIWRTAGTADRVAALRATQTT
jgi:hypothetical protein